MTVRVLRTTEEPDVIVLYLTLCTLVVSIFGCAYLWTSLVVPSTAIEVISLFSIGCVGYLAQICMTKALAKGKVASVLCVQYISIVFSQLAGWFIFGEYVNYLGNLGMAVIVTSMCTFMWFEVKADS